MSLSGAIFIALAAPLFFSQAVFAMNAPNCSTGPSGSPQWGQGMAGACQIPTTKSPQAPKGLMKGWELYTWQEKPRGTHRGGWRYALLAGTNREKVEAELKAASLQELSVLQDQLRELPSEAEVFWNPHAPQGSLKFDLPPVSEARKIRALCAQLKLRLKEPAGR